MVLSRAIKIGGRISAAKPPPAEEDEGDEADGELDGAQAQAFGLDETDQRATNKD